MIDKNNEKLIDICREIDFEYDILMDLSEKKKENTKNYSNELNKLKTLLNLAIEYCNTFSINTLQNMIYYINEKYENFEKYYYDIAISIIDYVLNQKYIETRIDETEIENDEINYDDETSYDEIPLDETDIEEANKWFETYPDELDNQYDAAMGIIYTNVARKIFIELLNLKPKTKKEKELQLKLLKLYTSRYKYDFLTRSVTLELISIEAKFNPFKIFIYTNDDYSSLYFNESIDILKTICNKKISSLDLESLDDSFEILCLFEMIEYLNIEQLNKLKEACIEYTTSNNPNTLGKICLTKIQSKTD